MFLLKKKRAISNLTILIVAVIIVAALIGTVIMSGLLPSLGGKIVGSGNLKTEVMEFSDFSALDIGYGFEVEITRSSSYSVSITGDRNVFNRIEVSKSGDNLRIGLKPGIVYSRLTLKAKITLPELVNFEASGGTHGTVEGFNASNKFVLELSGGSNIRMMDMVFEELDADLSGGSSIEIDGEATDLTLEASSGSSLDLEDLQVHDANIVLSGGSHGTIKLDGRLDADLSGGSRLEYIGEPTMGNITTSGGSSIRAK